SHSPARTPTSTHSLHDALPIFILSMTPRERAHPELIDGARKRRIARGSGVQPADINRLLRAREAMQKLARQFGGVNRKGKPFGRSEEHTSELQSLRHLVCRLLL